MVEETPVAGVFSTNVPLLAAPEQSNDAIEGSVISIFLIHSRETFVQCPVKVPDEEGVPVKVYEINWLWPPFKITDEGVTAFTVIPPTPLKLKSVVEKLIFAVLKELLVIVTEKLFAEFIAVPVI
ncbi:hypothetical protein [uncultured Chryseobacterium sp.]|uniref:hypothetical protein n=1 Tax=uncultured Chryseobacterium sp. TaxID=259322 RepID=UPI0027DC6F7E|nr:hypothetical protein [uncultured Chryseobacterium sp.]